MKILNIAGTALRVHAGFPFLDWDDPVYLPFVASPRPAPAGGDGSSLGARPAVGDRALGASAAGEEPLPRPAGSGQASWGPGADPGFLSYIDIELTEAAAPENDSPLLFVTDSWSLQAEGEGYRLSLLHAALGRAHTVVRSDAATERVLVHIAELDDPASGGPLTQVGSDPDAPRRNPVTYSLDELLMIHHAAPRSGVLVHSAGVVVGGRALVCPGVSRAGKSTLSRLFVAAGLEETLLSDDRIFLRPAAEPQDAASAAPAGDQRGPDGFLAWGTPWPGDARIAKNESAPLGALLFLVKGDSAELTPLTVGEAMRRLMPVVSIPWYDRERGNQVLETCARVVESVPCYDLRFSLDDQVVRLLTGRSWG